MDERLDQHGLADIDMTVSVASCGWQSRAVRGGWAVYIGVICIGGQDVLQLPLDGGAGKVKADSRFQSTCTPTENDLSHGRSGVPLTTPGALTQVNITTWQPLPHTDLTTHPPFHIDSVHIHVGQSNTPSTPTSAYRPRVPCSDRDGFCFVVVSKGQMSIAAPSTTPTRPSAFATPMLVGPPVRQWRPPCGRRRRRQRSRPFRGAATGVQGLRRCEGWNRY